MLTNWEIFSNHGDEIIKANTDGIKHLIKKILFEIFEFKIWYFTEGINKKIK